MAPSSSRPPLPRLRSVPPADPPYDDERAPGTMPVVPPPTQGALALAYDPPDLPPHDGPQRGASLSSRTGGAAGSLPDERRLRSLGQAMAEILAGRRPPSTVADRLTERAYTELVRAGKMIHATRPPLVGLPHVNQPRDGAVEVCALVHCGERSHVLAIRLERHGIQWLCTDFETA
ncbi:Rv3235 family protein [Sphaerisporangium corydalis]|uniref:Rv3235 family protein n=1 Tax=Sphaerisporangium corydalis TaxID=1441875 RepID=A0ABV9ED89_9ACTN|nr:Rv3235 family protein [Sphaerisporangium corydalis]